MIHRRRQRAGIERKEGHELQHQSPNYFSATPSSNSYFPQHQHHPNDYDIDTDSRRDYSREGSQLRMQSTLPSPYYSNQSYHKSGMLTILLLVFLAAWWGFSTILFPTWNLVVKTIPGLSGLVTVGVGRRSRGLAVADNSEEEGGVNLIRPNFVYEHPYVSSSYYTSTKSMKTLTANEEIQVRKNLLLAAEEEALEAAGKKKRGIKTRLAIVRPFCEFDAEALPSTFSCWNGLPPCKAAREDIGDDYGYDEEIENSYELTLDGELMAYKKNSTLGDGFDDEEDRHLFDFVGSDAMKNAVADVFLFYSQTFSENEVAIKAVDTIIDQFFEPGGWSQCFGNIYAIEANIPQELDLYIPSAQEELYNWVK